MGVIYPDVWSTLVFPNIRAELLEYLKSAANPGVFRDAQELEFIVHFFFDDHDFVPSTHRLIGKTLLDEGEAATVEAFVAALDIAIGPRSRPLDQVSADDWAPVAAAAKTASERLVTKGEPTFDH